MVRPSEDRLQFPDFAKGVAILGIVLCHYSTYTVPASVSRVASLGGAGVHVFLILSGFGLALRMDRFDARTFFRRRVGNVLVAYYLVVTALFLVNLVKPYFPEDGLYAYLGNIFLFKAFDESIFNSFGGDTWFLSVIVGLYLTFPLLVSACKRFGAARLLVGGSIVSLAYLLAIAALGLSAKLTVSDFFLRYLWEFCLGIWLASAYRKKRKGFWDLPAWLLALASVVGIGAAAALAIEGGTVGRLLNDVPSAIGYTALIALAYQALRRVPSAVTAFVFLGGVSYEIYLTHMFLWVVLATELPSLQVATVLAIPVSILAAAALQRATSPLASVVAGKRSVVHRSYAPEREGGAA